MKLQLDTIEKVIRIEESVNLGDLIEALDKLLPDGVWKKFKLEVNSTIIWRDPIIINPTYPTYPYPYWQYPWYTPRVNPSPYTHPYTVGDAPPTQPYITYGLTSGSYCIEL